MASTETPVAKPEEGEASHGFMDLFATMAEEQVDEEEDIALAKEDSTELIIAPESADIAVEIDPSANTELDIPESNRMTVLEPVTEKSNPTANEDNSRPLATVTLATGGFSSDPLSETESNWRVAEGGVTKRSVPMEPNTASAPIIAKHDAHENTNQTVERVMQTTLQGDDSLTGGFNSNAENPRKGPSSPAPAIDLKPALANDAGAAVPSFQPQKLDKSSDSNILLDSLEDTASFPAQSTISARPSPTRSDLPSTISRQLVEAAPQGPGQSVEIKLSPAELGRVRMSMTVEEGQIVVQILAERPETLDLMRRNIDTLNRDFEALGYENAAFSFAEQQEQDIDQQKNQKMAQNALVVTDDSHAAAQTPKISLSNGVDLRL